MEQVLLTDTGRKLSIKRSGNARIGAGGQGQVYSCQLGNQILAAKLNWPTLVSTSSVVAAFVFSAAVGIFFGYYPARKASQLDPIDALRYE